MASKQYDSASVSDEPEETTLYTRAIQNVAKARKSLFEQTEQTEAAAHRPTRASTSAQRPVREDVSSSLSSFHNDSDQDKTVDPGQLSEDSSDARSRHAEERSQRELRKKRPKQTGIASGKSPCFYNNNYFHYGKFCIL